MALQLSLEGFLADLRLDALFGIHFLEPSVLGLELLEALDHGCVHASEFSSPLIDRGRAHVVFAGEIGNGHPGFVLFQDRHDLAVGKS